MLKTTIVSPERTLFAGEAEKVFVPGAAGRFEILTGHAPIVSILSAGTVRCEGVGEPFEVAVSGGFVEVARDEVSVCVECSAQDA
ncbi:MAG: ATP synthase F1 subunit epsilon [Bacteroidaceae bacterium]|nr:ATP synthase F1 subunit epsilon [Bacteroidaceae bacterium]